MPRLALLFTAFITLVVQAQTPRLETVLTGLNGPVDIAHCGDDRLFIVERAGLIRIVRPNGLLLAGPFLDITGPVNNTGNEQGLLGMAFHPQYAQNGYFYLYYCAGTLEGTVRVSRFSVTNDPDVADANSEVLLWELPQPYANHKGGDIAFGPDGYLYFAPGDGGSANDPGNRAQNMGLGFGKMHRIDVDAGTPYAIPPSNPFANADDVDTLRTIFASGLRNPFRFGFDTQNGDLWIGDVGQSSREEVDRIAAGDLSGPNFGWRCREGIFATPNVSQAGCTGPYVNPVFDHDHSFDWCSVIGGRVYRGARYPFLFGRYLYTDFCLGRWRSLRPNGAGGWIGEVAILSTPPGTACIAEDVTGELFAVNTSMGVLSHLIDSSAVVRVAPELLLEGAFDTGTGLMHDSLRTRGLVPLVEPYTTALGYPAVAYGGGETTTPAVLAITGNDAVVDWVRVELRPVSHPRLVAASRQGLLQRDGDVVAANGTDPLTVHVGPGTYLVVVRHRNHLACMTASGVSLSATAVTADFASPTTTTFGTDARKSIGSAMALWAGNANPDAGLRYTGSANDRDPVLVRVGSTTPNNTAGGYHPEDLNLDGSVKYTGAANDRDPVLVNVGSTTPNNVRAEQLP